MSSKKTPAKSAAAKPSVKAKPATKPKGLAKSATQPAAKPAVKSTAKPAAKPATKLAVKAAAKPVVKSVAKPIEKVAAKPVEKASGFKAAASKFTSVLLGRKSEPVKPVPVKPAAKPVAPAQPAAKTPVANKPAKPAKTTTKSAPAVVAKPAPKKVQRRIVLDPQKPLMTEAQIRKMSDKDYMNDAQLTFFYHRLLQMRQEVLGREVEVKERLHEREVFADPADRATAEEEHWLDLRLRERESYLLRKIDEAVRRIESDEFGYCEKTGDPIGIPRLLARPTATVCVDVKGQDERVEAQFRDR